MRHRVLRSATSRSDIVSNGVLHMLRAHRLPFIIYHKSSARCRPPRLVDVEPYGELVLMPHNLGRECSGYLRFIVERYERTLPQMIAFCRRVQRCTFRLRAAVSGRP